MREVLNGDEGKVVEEGRIEGGGSELGKGM